MIRRPSKAAGRAARTGFKARAAFAGVLGALVLACQGGEPGGRLVVFAAGSLGPPLRAALDSFALGTGVRGDLETAGSLETARKLTELGKTPDIVALADEDVFPEFLMPEFVRWYARFGVNEMVLSYNPRSRFATGLDSADWWKVLLQDGVATGRSDPDFDPSGYRTLLLFQLAERHYGVPGLAARLEDAAPARYMRPNEADLVGLLQAGELDFAWQYRSLATSAGLPFLALPAAINLGSPADSAAYAEAEVTIRGASPGDTLVLRGRPIVYGISIPVGAPNRALAEQFLGWLLSRDGARVLGRKQFEALAQPSFVGTGIPGSLLSRGGATDRH